MTAIWLLWLGTNNLKPNGSEVIMKKFEQLVVACKQVRSRRVTLVGIPNRFDLFGDEWNRRVLVNQQLKRLCELNQLEYLDYEPARSRLHDDGLHPNGRGQHELAKSDTQPLLGFFRLDSSELA